MRCIANYEIESDISIVSDDIRLKLRHPKDQFQAYIKNIVRPDYSTPFLLSLQIAFDAPSLDEAREIGQERLAECLNMLAFTTGASVKLHRTRQIVDCTATNGMRNCLVWADSFGHEDPQPFLDDNIVSSIERLLQFNPPPAIQRALRWYRIGIYASIPEDQFQYFWFALEIIAEHQKSSTKVNDKCPVCKTALYCESCKTHPTHKPYPKQAIRDLIVTVDSSCDGQTIDALDKTRNALMHGATLKEVEKSLPKASEDMVDVLGRILFMALVHQFPKELFKEEIHMGSPSTYIQRTMTGIAKLSTVVPITKDGELDDSAFSGLKISMETGRPPQSAKPTGVLISLDQHKRLGQLAYEKGDHQELCKRVYDNARSHGEKVIAVIFSTDLKRIQEALRRNETGKWQDLFREILMTTK
ncbi:MAG: hypothetical protein EPN55_00175 [Gammaproteobacteria bacterium]|nr:MAG: hypothetical protein EPN55_00175 [Gammaproteobacteria bacterium]